MNTNEYSVFRDLQVLLDEVGSLINRQLVPGKGVLRCVARRPTMRDQERLFHGRSRLDSHSGQYGVRRKEHRQGRDPRRNQLVNTETLGHLLDRRRSKKDRGYLIGRRHINKRAQVLPSLLVSAFTSA